MRVAFMKRETNEMFDSYQLMRPVGSTSLGLIHSRRVFGCLRNKHARGIKSYDLIGWPRVGSRLEFILREFGTKYGSPSAGFDTAALCLSLWDN